MIRLVVPTLLALAGCGRVGFDPIGDGGSSGDGAASGDGAPPTPLAFWHLDEGTGTTAHDSIGQIDGTLQAGASITPTWTTGHTGQAVTFAGDGDNIGLGLPASMKDLPALTIDAWIRPTSVTYDGQSHCILDKGDTSAGWSVFTQLEQDGAFGFLSYFGGGNYLEIASAGGLLATGTWSHVAVTWDGSATPSGVHLYLDGAEVSYGFSQPATPPRPSDGAIPMFINCNANTSLAGTIDEVRIFGLALSPAQVAAL
jgi:hypothetical protein